MEKKTPFILKFPRSVWPSKTVTWRFFATARTNTDWSWNICFIFHTSQKQSTLNSRNKTQITSHSKALPESTILHTQQILFQNFISCEHGWLQHSLMMSHIYGSAGVLTNALLIKFLHSDLEFQMQWQDCEEVTRTHTTPAGWAWLGSLDSFPQEHFTVWSLMVVPWMEQIAFVAASFEPNLQAIIRILSPTAAIVKCQK